MLIFRADGNSQIGAGHIMRCLAIANAAAESGIDSVFVTASDDMKKTIESRNIVCHVMDTDYRHMEHEDIISVAEKYKPSAIIVDSYYVTEAYLKNIHKWCQANNCELVYIDDVKAWAYTCDLLINYNIYAKEADYMTLYANEEGRAIPRMLLGASYVPLRKEFANAALKDVKQHVTDVFVSTGGADPEHMACELMKKAITSDYIYHFVVGSMNRDKEMLKSLAKQHDNIYVYENVTDMSSLMGKCDIAVSAAGSTLYELCAMKVPTVTYVMADNQRELSETFDSKGIIANIGDVRIIGREETAGLIIDSVETMANNYEARCKTADRMKSIVDGRGTYRIIEALQ